MSGVSAALLRRLRNGTLSRNRAPRAFGSPAGRRALRAHRTLRSIERDLRLFSARGRVEVSEDRGRLGARRRVTVLLTFEALRAERVTRLESWEFEQLCEDPGVHALLRGEGTAPGGHAPVDADPPARARVSSARRR